MKPAIFWYSNMPTVGTGYGTQTKSVVDRLADLKYPVAIHANYGLEATGTWYQTDKRNKILCYPRGHESYSNDTIVAHYTDWSQQNRDRQTIMITLFDAWVLKNPKLGEIPKILSWVPIDHTPIPPSVAEWCAQPNVTPIAMSKFGAEQLAARDIMSIYIPHTFERVFKPTEGGGDLINVPDDAFLIMMNAANKATSGVLHRKAFSENFLAAAMVMSKHDDVYMYVHTEPAPGYGWDLPRLAKACGIPENRLIFPSAYSYHMGMYTSEHLAKLYTRADVLLAPSLGEGFGIPTIEAQACGTPVIASNATASAELASSDSYLVEGQPEWDAAQSAFWFRPFVHSIANALLSAYDRGMRRSDASIEHVAEYRADGRIVADWRGALELIL